MTQPERSLASLVAEQNKDMALPVRLTGEDIGRFTDRFELHLTEISMALGINTAALYTKKKSTDRLSSSVCLLLRLYAAFPSHVPRVVIPDADKLIEKISQIDPSFKKGYLGPLLGLETNSSFRLVKDSRSASQTVQYLIFLIDKLLDESPDNWEIIKQAVEVEAESRSIIPASSVWPNGGWSRATRSESNSPDKKPIKRQTIKRATDEQTAATSPTLRPIKR